MFQGFEGFKGHARLARFGADYKDPGDSRASQARHRRAGQGLIRSRLKALEVP